MIVHLLLWQSVAYTAYYYLHFQRLFLAKMSWKQTIMYLLSQWGIKLEKIKAIFAIVTTDVKFKIQGRDQTQQN